MGSRFFCGPETAAEIGEIIDENGCGGIHFIDSGDYHYITRLMTERMGGPYTLVLFDHHTDMQRPAFGDMLTCGSWAAEVIEKDPNLRRFILIGPPKASFDAVDEKIKEKVEFIGQEVLLTDPDPMKSPEYGLLKEEKDIPVYISIDKDVLSEEYAVTNWDQGNMTLNRLMSMLAYLIRNHSVSGIDICGDLSLEEDFSEFEAAEAVNRKTDERLYSFLENILMKKTERKRNEDKF